MSALVFAIPSKGRLQEQALAFLGDAGLNISQSRGNRDYAAKLSGVDNVTVALLSAAERHDRHPEHGDCGEHRKTELCERFLNLFRYTADIIRYARRELDL